MIRIVAYNVNGAVDPGAVTEVLSALRPDVACVLELPGRLTTRRICARSGLQIVVRAGRRRVRTGILTGERVRVLTTSRVPLPGVAGSPDRVAVHAIVGVGSLRLSVVAAQLGLRPETRGTHAVALERFLDSVDVPAVLAGDLGEPPGGPTAVRFAGAMKDAFAVAGQGPGETYPTPDPTARHDFVFVSPQLTVERCWVAAGPPVDAASHHRPVVVEIAARDRGSGFTRERSGRARGRGGPVPAGDDHAEPAA